MANSETRFEVEVAFCLSSETVRAREITAMIGLEPTRTRQKGEPSGSGKRTFAHHAWFLEPTLERGTSMETQVRWLLGRLLPSEESIRRLLERGVEASLDVAVMSGELMTTTRLPADLVAGLGRLGAQVSHTHYLSSDDELGAQPRVAPK